VRVVARARTGQVGPRGIAAIFLGIDIGTSAVKVVALDDAQRVQAESSAALAVQRPAPLHSEQDPEDWWNATCKAILDLPERVRAQVDAIGLAGQMHGATLLDARGAVLRPAILWNDARSGAQCAALERALPKLVQITGNRAMPGFTAPKLLWVRDHEPDVFARVAKVLLPKDYVRWRLTGEYASDVSDAAGTLWLDTQARRWSSDALAACALREAQMPSVFEGCAVTGTLKPDVAAALGLRRVIVAAGVISTGQAMLSLGTSGVIFVADDRYRPNPASGVHLFCHALPERWHEMSVMLSAPGALDWAVGTLGFRDAAQLHELAQSRGAPCGTEFFLPYLTGERTPHNDPLAQGVFFGLTASTDRASLAQAVLEGVAFGLADGLLALKTTGCRIDTLTVIGGGARSTYWGGSSPPCSTRRSSIVRVPRWVPPSAPRGSHVSP
jgi:xylulokinase